MYLLQIQNKTIQSVESKLFTAQSSFILDHCNMFIFILFAVIILATPELSILSFRSVSCHLNTVCFCIPFYLTACSFLPMSFLYLHCFKSAYHCCLSDNNTKENAPSPKYNLTLPLCPGTSPPHCSYRIQNPWVWFWEESKKRKEKKSVLFLCLISFSNHFFPFNSDNCDFIKSTSIKLLLYKQIKSAK